MVVIITGASHVGKTRLAQMMMEKWHYPYISEDHIKMGLIRSGYTDLTPEDDDRMTEYLWPVIREMIKTAIENNQNMIVEGCYVPFDWKSDFSDGYLCRIKYICLCFSDSYIDRCFEDIKQYASCIETRLDDDCCTAESMKRDNQFYLDGCRSHGLEVVLIENDYAGAIKRILEQQIEQDYDKDVKEDR